MNVRELIHRLNVLLDAKEIDEEMKVMSEGCDCSGDVESVIGDTFYTYKKIPLNDWEFTYEPIPYKVCYLRRSE